MRTLLLLVLVTALGACTATPRLPRLEPGERPRQCDSLLGRPLHPMALPADVEAERLAQLADARAAWAANPRDVETIIWVGRRQAYLGRYDLAIATFTEGLRFHPGDARLLRHRGHRYITTRRFHEAIADLAAAAAATAGTPDVVEADGMPNTRNIPRSTLQNNIHYHLGLARYLAGDYAGALAAYDDCLATCTNDDMRVATLYWTYLALTRLGRAAEARRRLEPVGETMDVIENHAYHRLLMLFRGDGDADDLEAGGGDDIEDATTAYGLANWHLLEGDRHAGRAMLRRILELPAWPAFGYIAAEADVARGM